MVPEPSKLLADPEALQWDFDQCTFPQIVDQEFTVPLPREDDDAFGLGKTDIHLSPHLSGPGTTLGNAHVVQRLLVRRDDLDWRNETVLCRENKPGAGGRLDVAACAPE